MNTKSHNFQQMPAVKIYLFSIIAFICALLAAYMYLLSATVVHVVMQKQVTSEMRGIDSEIAKLESKFIEKQHAVSDEIATKHGFVEVKDKVFINKTSDSLALGASGL